MSFTKQKILEQNNENNLFASLRQLAIRLATRSAAASSFGVPYLFPYIAQLSAYLFIYLFLLYKSWIALNTLLCLFHLYVWMMF